jgi:hypothetical protein
MNVLRVSTVSPLTGVKAVTKAASAEESEANSSVILWCALLDFYLYDPS